MVTLRLTAFYTFGRRVLQEKPGNYKISQQSAFGEEFMELPTAQNPSIENILFLHIYWAVCEHETFLVIKHIILDEESSANWFLQRNNGVFLFSSVKPNIVFPT